MAAETKIIVHDTNVHPDTGHLTYTVKTRTVDGNSSWDGPLKQYGIDAQALRDRFNNDLSQFENFVAQEHRAFSGAHPEMVEAAMKRKGKVIG